jgi:hypothetical protein
MGQMSARRMLNTRHHYAAVKVLGTAVDKPLRVICVSNDHKNSGSSKTLLRSGHWNIEYSYEGEEIRHLETLKCYHGRRPFQIILTKKTEGEKDPVITCRIADCFFGNNDPLVEELSRTITKVFLAVNTAIEGRG